MKRNIFPLFLLILPLAALFIQAQDSCGLCAAPVAVYALPGDTLPVDSSFFLPSAITTKSKFPKRKEVISAYGCSHLFWIDLRQGHKSAKYFQLTDKLKVMQYKDSTRQVQLSPGAIDSLFALMGEKKSFVDNGEAGCFFPRHTFVFCNAAKQVIGYIEICLECRQVRTTPFPATKASSFGSLTGEGHDAMKRFLGQSGLVTIFKP